MAAGGGSDASATVYLSLDPAPYSPDGIKVTFDAVTASEISGTKEQLSEIMKRIGMVPVDQHNDGIVYNAGVEHNDGVIISNRGHECYYAGVTLSPINQIILSGAKPARLEEFTAAYNRALYTKFAYQMFVNEFVHAINSEVNKDMRAQIVGMIRETNFTKNADVTKFRSALRKIISNADVAVINDQILAARHGRIVDKNTLMQQIDEYTYEFDRTTLAELGQLRDHDDAVSKLRPICERIAIERNAIAGNTGDAGAFPNIYNACASGNNHNGSTSHTTCSKGKLIVDDLSVMVDLIAADLINPIKAKYILAGLFMDIIINYFDFIKRPGETISVERVIDFSPWNH